MTKKSKVLVVTPMVCHKCGRGYNNSIFDKKGAKVGNSGSSTLHKDGNRYVCTDCNPKRLAPRRERRGNV